MSTNQELVGAAVHKIRAYSINTRDPYIFTSRIIWPDYVDMRLFIGSEESNGYRTQVINIMAETVKKLGKFDYICGVVTADVPFASMVAHDMKKNMFYIREMEKGHGKGRAIEGVDEGAIEGKTCIHLGDLMTTGKTGTIAHEQVVGEGGKLPFSIIVFDRLQGGAKKLLELKPPIDTIPLCVMDNEFYQQGIKEESYSVANLDEVYRAKSFGDNKQWGHEFLQKDPEFVRRQLQRSIKNGELVKASVIESLDQVYPDLLEGFTPLMNKWLKELGVKNTVKVGKFEYNP